MAKYVHIPGSNMFAYALDECEDYIMLDAYLELKEDRSGWDAKNRYIKTFEYYYLQEGGMLNDNVLMQLNASIRRLGRDSIVLVNGHSTNYSVLRGQEKVQMRKRILDHLRQLPADRREDVIMQKRAAAARLTERSSEFTDKPPPAGSLLSTPEIERRRAALAKARQAEVVQGDIAKKDLVVPPVTEEADDSDQPFMQEATTQDSIVELIVEIQELRAEFAELKQLVLEQKQAAVIPPPATTQPIQTSGDVHPPPMPVELFINISVKADGSVSPVKTKPVRKPAATAVPNGKASEMSAPQKKVTRRKVKSTPPSTVVN